VKDSPLVSIVTPFYNTADYLAECIESVLRQTYANWEYILLNNQSNDGSAEIAASYAQRFPDKVRVFQTATFLSQVQNYNHALSLIAPEGKYCKMVQADDWLFPECIERMVELAESHPKVGIVAAYELEGKWVSIDGLPYPSPEVPGRDVCRLFFLENLSLFGSPTSLLMRSDVVRSRTPFYEERHAPFEDSHACFDVLESWNYGLVHQVLTYSRRDNDSFLLRMRPYRFGLFSRLAKILAHGKKYLSADEYSYFLRDAEHKYFMFLGRSALQGRDAKFWAFHRERLGSIGYSLDAAFMAKWIGLVVLDYAGNPKRTLEYLWPRRKRLWSVTARFFRTMRGAFHGRKKAEQS